MVLRSLILTLGVWLLASTAVVQAQSQGLQVIVQPVTMEAVQNKLEALGTLRSNESIRLTSNVTKTVTHINFEDGQRVEQGQILVEMTSAEEIALLNEARFTTDEAKQQLDRVESLTARGAASQSLLDQRIREYEASRARYAAIESRLQDLRLAAPFSGVVGLRNISVGALVSPGDLITTLNDDSQMKLDFAVPAIYIRNLRAGLPIIARTRALGEMVFEGEVYSIDNQVDPVTRAITVRALLPNDDNLLRQGLLMSVEMFTDEREALIVSEAALLPLGSNNYVYAVIEKEDGLVAERRQVVLGQRYQGVVEILSGVEEGERVITHGLQRVRDGMVVSILAEETGQEPLRDLLHVVQQ